MHRSSAGHGRCCRAGLKILEWDGVFVGASKFGVGVEWRNDGSPFFQRVETFEDLVSLVLER